MAKKPPQQKSEYSIKREYREKKVRLIEAIKKNRKFKASKKVNKYMPNSKFEILQAEFSRFLSDSTASSVKVFKSKSKKKIAKVKESFRQFDYSENVFVPSRVKNVEEDYFTGFADERIFSFAIPKEAYYDTAEFDVFIEYILQIAEKHDLNFFRIETANGFTQAYEDVQKQLPKVLYDWIFNKYNDRIMEADQPANVFLNIYLEHRSKKPKRTARQEKAIRKLDRIIKKTEQQKRGKK